jgi:hypothetical protein
MTEHTSGIAVNYIPHSPRRVLLAALLAMVVGCGLENPFAPVKKPRPTVARDSAESGPAPTQNPSSLAAPLVPPARAVPRADSLPNAAWKITPKAIASVRLGSKLTAAQLAGPELESRYAASYYSDAQPLEGFVLYDPPVLALVSGGPFVPWGRKNPGEPAPAEIKANALLLARAGKLAVQMVVVTDPRPKTAAGISVGSDYPAFAKAYPKSRPSPFPALWEEPSCIAKQDGLWFFFDRCDSLPQAKLIRIVLRSANARL